MGAPRARNPDVRLPGWRGYAFALAALAAASSIRLALDPLIGRVQPYAFFYLSVAVAALWAGLGPALLATAVGAIVGTTFFLHADGTSLLASAVPCAVFLSVSGSMIALVRHVHRATSATAEAAGRLGEAEAEARARVALLQGLTESVLEGILIVGADGRRLYQNRRFEDIFAFPPDVLADPADERSIAWAASRVADPDAFREEILASYRRGTPVLARVRLLDGRVYDRYGAPVVHEGVRYGWVWTFRDDTARTRAEERLRETEGHLRRVLDRLYAFVGVMRPDGVVEDVNRAPLEAAGLAASDVLGKPIWETHWWSYSPDLQARVRDAVDRARAGQIVRFDAPIRTGDRLTWIDFQLAPLTDDEGRVTHLVPSAMDVTARREAEAALRESQERFRLLLDSTAEAIYGLDTDGRCIFVNQACVRLLGYPAEEMIGRDMHDLVHHSDEAGAAIPRQDCPIQRAFRSGEAIHLPHEMLWRKDGTWFPAEYRARPTLQDGRIVGAVVSFLDITERVRAEESLRRATTLLAAISDATGDVIFAKDREGRLTFANPGTVALVGHPEAEILGRTDVELLQDREAARRVMENDRRIMATGVAEELEEIVPLPDGTRRVWVSRKVPYVDAEGRVIGLLGVSRDITARKEAEDALAAARDELAEHAATLERTVTERTGELSETVEELEAFSYSLSHDMRAPLRAMKGFSQILEANYAECLGAEGGVYLARISRAAGRLDQLIQDVLSYSRVVREKIELRPVDVEKLVHQLVEENPALHPPQADVTVVSPIAPVIGHEAYLMQVLSNLVYNAVKFTRPGEPARVRIWGEATGRHVRVVVEDEGIGIPADAQARVFRMFERAHADPVYEGTGIGLTIVRKAVERMGGEAGVESEPGRGSRFWFRLERASVA